MCSATTRARCGCSTAVSTRNRSRSRYRRMPQHTGGKGSYGHFHRDAGGDLLRRPRDAPLQARRRGDRRGAGHGDPGRARGRALGLERRARGGAPRDRLGTRRRAPGRTWASSRTSGPTTSRARPRCSPSAAPHGRCAGRARGTAPARADPRCSRRRTPPSAGPCLNPWPEPPPTSHQSGRSGWRATRKCVSGVRSYWQTRAPMIGAPASDGNRRAVYSRASASSPGSGSRSSTSGSTSRPGAVGRDLHPEPPSSPWP